MIQSYFIFKFLRKYLIELYDMKLYANDGDVNCEIFQRYIKIKIDINSLVHNCLTKFY